MGNRIIHCMDIPAVMKEIETWPVDQRMLLLEELWEKLGKVESKMTLAQRREIDRRLAAYETDPGSAISWEQVQSEAERAG